MTTKVLHKSVLKNQTIRLAREPHSLEAVECLCERIESIAADLPEPVREYLAAVRAWASTRRSERVLSCAGMARHIARHKFGWQLASARIDFEDAVQEAMQGLTHAANLFDERRGLCFTTYATWWIRQSIQRMLDNQGIVRVPVERMTRDKFIEDVKRARRVLRLSEMRAPIEDSSPGECMVVDGRRDHRDLWESSADVADLMKCLPPKELLAVQMRFFEGLNLEQIGLRMVHHNLPAITKERVRQLLASALRRMRLHADGELAEA